MYTVSEGSTQCSTARHQNDHPKPIRTNASSEGGQNRQHTNDLSELGHQSVSSLITLGGIPTHLEQQPKRSLDATFAGSFRHVILVCGL